MQQTRIVCAAMLAAAAAIALPTVALAEFEIQESTVEKGEKEFEYRGAVHWGFPDQEKGEAKEGGDEAAGATEEEEEGPLRQSHDFEFEYGITERWLFSTTLTADEPLDEDFALAVRRVALSTSRSGKRTSIN